MAFADWPERFRTVTTLFLDPLNPRIPPTEVEPGERDLIEDLVKHDRVYELAKDIVDNGYYPIESLIGVVEDEKTYIVEGNRRLAALKLLINPNVGPEEEEARFRALSNRIDQNTIKKVRVVIAPSRQDAAPIIMNKHTKPQIESWAPLMKSKYYRRMLLAGLSAKDLSEQYNIPIPEIIESLRLYKIYEVACSLDLPQNVAENVKNPREFKATNLERLLGDKDVRDFLGIEFKNGDSFEGHIAESEFSKGFSKMVSDIATNKITVSKIYNKKDRLEYINQFGKDKPDLNKEGSFTAESLLKAAGKKPSAPVKAKPKKEKRKPPKPISVLPRSLDCNLNNQRILSIFDELKKLRVAQFPNATAVLMRSLLEMALSYYLDRTGDRLKIINSIRQKNPNLPKNYHPTLTEMLKHITSDKCTIIQNPNLKKALKKFASERNELLSVDSLHFFVHNEHYMPTEERLRAFSVQLQGLFEIILIEPE